MITIVNYGLGNIQAFLNVFKRLNIEAATAERPEQLSRATKVILPGVGAFDHAMDRLNASGMRDVLDELALHKKIPTLGVCVGMQMLGRDSDEGVRPGLGWVQGRVRTISAIAPTIKLQSPHMGWNDVRPAPGNPLFDGSELDWRFYFLHSYYFECDRQENVAAVSNYGNEFSCAVRAGNIHGVQFHPEKSHHFGTQLLKNFSEM